MVSTAHINTYRCKLVDNASTTWERIGLKVLLHVVSTCLLSRGISYHHVLPYHSFLARLCVCTWCIVGRGARASDFPMTEGLSMTIRSQTTCHRSSTAALQHTHTPPSRAGSPTAMRRNCHTGSPHRCVSPSSLRRGPHDRRPLFDSFRWQTCIHSAEILRIQDRKGRERASSL